ncbi:BQ5605_C036g11541 [Microbotryum silenes-dioicae]|uniref:BQ5605_C036g11541 protein n=1 Tax=Microbotryum silenes-dioicae TaxID=796604 RepID=A0A2X0PGJ5_9BASI|nr:BQ5605_C036g11541 [Microbotryum silenes-dioicae]
MGQITFACNRRNNAMQHRNGLMTLACGANDRLTTFLRKGSNKYFHVTVDSVDVTNHVSDQQLDRQTELLYGTFGYTHIQNGDIVGAYNLRAYSAHQASLPPVISSISSQLPNPTRHLQPGSKLRYIERLFDWFLISWPQSLRSSEGDSSYRSRFPNWSSLKSTAMASICTGRGYVLRVARTFAQNNFDLLASFAGISLVLASQTWPPVTEIGPAGKKVGCRIG